MTGRNHGRLAETTAEKLGADALVTTVDEAVMTISQHLGTGLDEGYRPASVPPNELERMSVLRASGGLAQHGSPQAEAAAQRAADIFDVPLAMASLIDAGRVTQRGAGVKAQAVVAHHRVADEAWRPRWWWSRTRKPAMRAFRALSGI